MDQEFSLTSELKGSRLVITTSGYVNNVGGEAIAAEFNKHFGAGVKDVVINLAGSRVVNSIGMSFLLEILEQLQDADGKLVFTNLDPPWIRCSRSWAFSIWQGRPRTSTRPSGRSEMKSGSPPRNPWSNASPRGSIPSGSLPKTFTFGNGQRSRRPFHRRPREHRAGLRGRRGLAGAKPGRSRASQGGRIVAGGPEQTLGRVVRRACHPARRRHRPHRRQKLADKSQVAVVIRAPAQARR